MIYIRKSPSKRIVTDLVEDFVINPTRTLRSNPL
jgi:hypothetical protein